MKSAEPSSGCATNKRGLFRSARFLRALLESNREGIVVASPDGEIVFANRLAEELWGYGPAKLTGMEIGRLFHRQIALVDWGQEASKTARALRLEALRADGSITGLAVNLRPFTFEGREYRILEVSRLAVRTEEEIVEEQFRVFESLELFAGGLAHEFNNILTGIMGNLHMALETGSRKGRMEPALLEGAYAATLRAREVTRELFQMSMGEHPVQGASTLPQLMCEASLMSLAGSQVHMEYDFAPDLRAAFIDAGQIGQVAHQLLRFAAERMGHSGRLLVAARNFRVNPGDSGFGGELLPGDYVVLAITMPEGSVVTADCSRLFEPYRVTGNGLTGLSLAICRCLVRRQGGLLRAAMTEEGELQLEVYLPACREVSTQAVALLRVDVPCIQGCHVLVMDDEELVRMVLKRSLEGMGHRVVTVSDGEEAVAAYEDAKLRGDRFDVVFLDLQVLHGSGGKEACRELLEMDPLATCVLISGNIGDEAMLDPSGYGFVDNLEKPFDLHEVGRVMNRLMERLGRGDSAVDASLDDDLALDCVPEPTNIVAVDFRFPQERT